jgi:spore germination protein YaaH
MNHFMKKLTSVLRTPYPVLLLALCLTTSCAELYTVDSADAAASDTGKPIELSGWLVFWEPLSWQSFQANVGRLARVYPEAYHCTADGGVERIDATGADKMAQTVALAHAHGCKVIGMMNNYAGGDFDKLRVERFLNDPAKMEAQVQALLAFAKADGIDGLDVDYESLAAEDRINFTRFVQRLGVAAHAAGLKLGIALHPKTSEPGTWAAPQAQDWAALGEAVDYFHPMTYDYHWGSGSPGTIAPPDWVREVTAFAAKVVDPSKVELGLKTAGMAWTPKGADQTWTAFLALQAKAGKAQRDETTRELTLALPTGECWMPDAETSLVKARIARELGVRGLAMWVLGSEDPRTWAALDQFNGKTPAQP